MDELQAAYESLQDSHTTVTTVLSRERELRERLEAELGEAQEHIKVLGAGVSKEVSQTGPCRSHVLGMGKRTEKMLDGLTKWFSVGGSDTWLK